jgi:hypothetical protein
MIAGLIRGSLERAARAIADVTASGLGRVGQAAFGDSVIAQNPVDVGGHAALVLSSQLVNATAHISVKAD